MSPHSLVAGPARLEPMPAEAYTGVMKGRRGSGRSRGGGKGRGKRRRGKGRRLS